MWTASEALPVRPKRQPRTIIPCAFQNKARFSSAKAMSSLSLQVCCCVVSAEDMGQTCAEQRIHQ